jgi:threonine dehydrogenase-like Zn-dependent dehydrogenase
MQGIAFLGNRNVDLVDFPDPTPGPGEVVLAMKASGICGTDLHFYRPPRDAGKPLTVAGHEPCGVVAELGAGVDSKRWRVGDRVMVHHYSGCGVCEHCTSGWTQLCQTGPNQTYGGNANGGHAPYLLVPADRLVPLDDALSFETGAAISCGTGTAYAALRRLNLSGADTIAIFGQGPVGLSATQFATSFGARVIALDVNAERLARAKELGADETIDPNAGDPVQAIRELTHGRGVDASLETSGAPSAGTAAIQAPRIWGTAAFVTGFAGLPDIHLLRDVCFRQLNIFGHWTFNVAGQLDCARYVAERDIDVDAVFTHRWKLDQADEAYKLTDAQSAGKGVFLL